MILVKQNQSRPKTKQKEKEKVWDLNLWLGSSSAWKFPRERPIRISNCENSQARIYTLTLSDSFCLYCTRVDLDSPQIPNGLLGFCFLIAF